MYSSLARDRDLTVGQTDKVGQRTLFACAWQWRRNGMEWLPFEGRIFKLVPIEMGGGALGSETGQTLRHVRRGIPWNGEWTPYPS